MAALQADFVKTLTGPCGVKPGAGIVVAVSGGPDSMALLHLLAATGAELPLGLSVVWVDHGLRPEETGQEEKTVALAAERLGLPFFARKVDTAALARRDHLSLEQAARTLRYGVLRQIFQDQGADAIAVAHTADDQAEEILLRLLRGSGRKGVSGMRMRNREVIRPLLETEKKEIISWLQQRDISCCYDSSNSDLRFWRNRVRHQLLPFLKTHFDDHIGKSLRKTAATLAEDEDLLEQLTAEAYAEVVVSSTAEAPLRLQRLPFSRLHGSLQRRVVERLLWQLGSRAGFDHIMLVVQAAAGGRTHSELHLSRGLRVGIFRDYLEFSSPVGSRPWRGRLFP